jgi:hypothetical protein
MIPTAEGGVMVDRLPLGPYRVVRTVEGIEVPWYIVPFDEEGRCTGPQTRAELVKRAGREGYSDIVLFAHGWNNDWLQATDRYEKFLKGYLEMRRERGLPVPSEFRPLLVGIFWPSKLLVERDRQAPDIAGDEPDDEPDDEAVASERQEIADLAAVVPQDAVERFYELTQRKELDEAEALELATLLAPLYATDADETAEAPPTPKHIAASWQVPRRRRRRTGDLTDYGTGARTTDDPLAAGFLDFLRPREIVRSASVWQMKDRAGRVGARGVAPLLTELLGSGARVHAVGHSFGAKVVLSAITAPVQLPDQVQSVLLLQAAVSHLCFASDANGRGRPGGYRPALGRVRTPILSTFSEHDDQLTRMFHWALRRDTDLGDAGIAADEPPSRYAALGGFGPRGLGQESKLIDILKPVARYDLTVTGIEVYGIDATPAISGHGEVSNEATWWMLYNLVVS